jgi:hypothetical protein
MFDFILIYESICLYYNIIYKFIIMRNNVVLIYRPAPVTAYIVLGCFSVVILVLMPVSLIIRHNCFNDDGQYIGCPCDSENPQIPLNTIPNIDSSSESESEHVVFSRAPQGRRENADIDGTVTLHPPSPLIIPSPPVSFFAKFREKFKMGKRKPHISSSPKPNEDGSHPLKTTEQPLPIPYTDSVSINNPEYTVSGPESTPAILNPSHTETSQLAFDQKTKILSSTPENTHPKTFATIELPPLSPINKTDSTTHDSNTSLHIDNPHTNPKSTLLDLSDDEDDYSGLPPSVLAAIYNMRESETPPTSQTRTESFDLDVILQDVSDYSPPNRSPSYYETEFDEMARSRSQTPDRD